MTKRFVFLLFLLGLLNGCNRPGAELDSNIEKVETSLSPTVHIVGDSLWRIEDRMKFYGVPGVSIAVIHDNKIVWSKAYGIMDKESKSPVTTQTLFQAGSISKPVAAYGALKFAESGKINPDANVNDYLKSWKLPDNEFTREKKVTLKLLLSHQGGLTVHGFLGYSPDLSVPSLVQVLDGLSPANSAAIRVEKIPGTNWSYSGGGYTIMQQMLMDVSGKTFPELMKVNVLDPLGMTNSTYEQPLPSDKMAMAATGYLPDGTMTKGKRHTYPEMAAAGLWTTADDLARFAIDIQQTLKGESNKVLSQKMAKEMVTPYIVEFDGLGVFVSNLKGDNYFEHGGWDEGFSSQLTAHRDKGYGVVVLTNSNHPPFIDELIRAVALTYSWDNYVPTYKPLMMNESEIQSLSGRYRNGVDGLVKIYFQDHKVFFKYLRGSPVEMFKISQNVFSRRDNREAIRFEGREGSFARTLYIEEGKDTLKFKFPRMRDDEKVPYEWFLEGDYTRALKEYEALRTTHPDDPALSETRINDNGYQLMNEGKIPLAVELLKINTILFPKSANVYDSYAEACVKNGDKPSAIANYRKSLGMNPANEGARKNLKELLKK